MQAKWFDEVYSRSPQLWAAVEILLAMLLKSGLAIGKERAGSLNLNDMETIGVYVMDCEAERLEAEDVAQYGQEARRSFKFFPSSGELAKAIAEVKAARKPKGTSDPAYFVREIHRGEAVIAVGSKAALQKRGVPAFETEKEALESVGASMLDRRASVAPALHGRVIASHIP